MRFLVLMFFFGLCATFACGQTPDTTAAWQALIKAKQLAGQGKFDSSIVAYKQTSVGYKNYAAHLRDQQAADAIKAWERHFNARMQIGWLLNQTGHSDTALAVLNATLIDAQNRLGVKHRLVSNILNTLGVVCTINGAYDTGLEYHQKALALRLELFGQKHMEVASSYNNIGIVYNYKSAFDRALDCYQKALTMKLEFLGPKHQQIAETYDNMGLVYHDRGAYDQAMDYFQKALALKFELLGPKHPQIGESYNNIGAINEQQGAYDGAKSYYHKALALRLEALGPHHPVVATGYSNLGSLHSKMGAYDQALDYHQKALALFMETLGPRHPNVADCYFNMGGVYMKAGADDQALDYFQKALALRLEVIGPKNAEVAAVYWGIGTVYERKEAYEQALVHYEKSLAAYIPSYQSGYLYTGLGVTGADVLNSTLRYTTKTLMAHPSTGAKGAALATVHFTDRLIDSLRVAYTYENDKLQLGQDAHNIYTLAIDVARWNKLDKEAFYFAEKNKAAVLEQSLNESDALRFGQIPDSLIQKDKDLKLDLAFYNKAIIEKELACPDCDSTLIRSYQATRFDRQQQYATLKTTWEQTYPEYFALKYKQHTTGVDELQKTFLKENPNTAILEYFVSDTVLFAFCITKEAYKIHRLKLDTTQTKGVNTLQADVRALTQALSSPRLPGWSVERYTEPAARLYEVLLKPFEKEIKGKDLVLIPDGELQKIPFEALLRDRPLPEEKQWRDLSYLARFHDISYHYSATLFLDQWRKPTTAGQGFVAFAPVFADTTTGRVVTNVDVIETPFIAMLSRGDTAGRAFLNDGSEVAPLPGTEREVKAIYDLFTQKRQPAQYYLSGNADEATVTTTDLTKYKYIHFATHGLTDEDHPDRSCLILAQTPDSTNDNLLTGSEMYGLNLEADLVVLSACQTGKGQLRQGEGVIGLTRGLLYAGARNIIVSQWNVNDASTAELMTRFYTYLLNGQSNRAALRNAKLELLSGPYACPHYWAPFVLVGR